MYVLTKITPLDEITNRDQKVIQSTIYQAKKSVFDSSKRLAACLMVKGQCILWRKPT